MNVDDFMRWVEFDPNTGCWLWSRGQNGDGYGICQRDKRTLLAHRVAWSLFHGDAAGKLVCHKCDTPACVNPDHLFVGSQADNMADMRRKGRADRKLGERNGRASITDDQACEIRWVLASRAFTPAEIAVSYGISRQAVYRLASGETFPHVHMNWPFPSVEQPA